MKPRINVWIEKEGQVVLSTWRVSLLEAIAETGSISAAAAQMNISYRRAWDKIRESEDRLGVKLVETQAGGSGGGGTELTRAAIDYVTRFQEFTASLPFIVEQRFYESFGEWTDNA